ncbi:unnamed protein product [Clonostachys solani]|uniref:Magnesium transport protein CorA n=1 Tax=Clonostachys solani TaxID=160281 RepID=A0A9P0EJ44_9HYPO|nr:unnamed protein product [Clonostachys solani]
MSKKQSPHEVYKASQAPELEHGLSISQSFDSFQSSQLSTTTRIKYVLGQLDGEFKEAILESRADIKRLPLAEEHSLQFFFVYKHLFEDPTSPIPDDSEKLQISVLSFDALATGICLPPAFIFALTRHYLPTGRGFRHSTIEPSTFYDCWYFLPVRVQVGAQSRLDTGQRGTAQMNPFHKLHLPDVGIDIFRSCVGIFTRVDPSSNKVTVASFDFMHGQWPKIALEPKARIAEVMRHRKKIGAFDARFSTGAFVHLVYISSTSRWWTNSLNSVNEQLIAYEITLQSELDAVSVGLTPEVTLTKLNRALHSISAHLHRYISELNSLKAITNDLIKFYASIYSSSESLSGEDLAQLTLGFDQVLSQVEASLDFALELEKKTKNILDLLFNRMQINSDRLLVANGKAMQEILVAMQNDANLGRRIADASHQLALEMKRDSIAMRTIAIITMVFLPGATFAAVFSMPFFSEEAWFGHVNRLWVWVAFTLPSTVACFIFYKLWRKQSLHLLRVEKDT